MTSPRLRARSVLLPFGLAASLLGALPLAALADDGPSSNGAATAEKTAEKPAEKTKSPEELERERIRKEIDELKLQTERLSAEYQLMQQRQRNELSRAELERQELASRAQLEQARLEQELADMKATVARIRAEADLAKAQRDRERAPIEAELDAAAFEARRRAAEAERAVELVRLEAQRLAAENQKRQEEVKRATMELQLARSGVEAEIAALKSRLELRSTQDQAQSRVVDPVTHRASPLDGSTLYVTDRRIPLNGPIGPGTADYVCSRIDFFNNRSHEEPIFIVIDNCPGGSVMEGYRIVKAIETSRAPVHVVVKSFAASMAAVITTLAPHSYALPNAIILHHQMSSGMRGNLTQQREQLDMAMEWAKRLADPVAAKMGVGYDEFVRLMYENNSNGDWEEFADKAQELKWVQHIVQEIREEGLRDQPSGARVELPFWMEAMQHDEKGNPFVKLPPLPAFDFWFMHNPSGFWR